MANNRISDYPPEHEVDWITRAVLRYTRENQIRFATLMIEKCNEILKEN